MNRLFGKQLSNLMEIGPNMSRQKNLLRILSKSTRQQNDENIRNILKKNEKINITLDPQIKNQRIKKINQQKQKQKQYKDQYQIKDIQLVPEYFDQCFQFMLLQENNNYQLCNYIHQQSQINQKMRGILLEWIAQLHYKFKMFPETLYTVSMIIDKYLSKKSVKKQNLQLIGTAAFFTAAKYQQTYHIPQLCDLVHFAAKSFTKSDIIKMQAEIIQQLNFDLIMITSYRFFQAFSKISKMQIKNFHLAQYVLQLSLLHTKFLQYKPSILASSVIYLINKIRKKVQCWSDLMVAATGYQQKDLKASARQLCYLLEKVDQLPNTKFFKKKFSMPEFSEVSRIKLQRKRQ